MIRIGLTGGIATGKSTVAAQFALLGVPSFDADQEVHALLRDEGPVRDAVAARFPEAVQEDRIDRRALGRIVFSDEAALTALEAILHPAVQASERAFEQRLRRVDQPCFIAEIPLLFEVGAERRFDLTVFTSCPPWVQARRALARPGMTEEKYRHIMQRQMPAHEKRKRADVEIFTGLGRAESLRQVKALLNQLGAGNLRRDTA
jgi:dephospho-CoA kinase